MYKNFRKTILMCHPAEFDVTYVINPWMTDHVSNCDNSVAMKQWHDLVALIGQYANVNVMSQAAALPDMVFTANAGLTVGNFFIPSNFKHPERQGEKQFFIDWFQLEAQFDVLELPENLAFEGAGDALFDRELPFLWMGYGHRTDLEVGDWLWKNAQLLTMPLKLVDDRFYHLDTCFCPLEYSHLMYYPGAFDETANQLIEQYIPEEIRIVVGEEDALNFACNAVNVGRHVFLNKASDELKSNLAAHHYEVHETPLSEFMKAGGSAKCLTIRLEEKVPNIIGWAHLRDSVELPKFETIEPDCE